jgi:hypothetical protein
MVVFLFGAPGWTRTNDLRLRSPLLYPAELPGQNYPVGSSVDASEASSVKPPQSTNRTKMVRVGRIEPPSPAWKAGILAVIRHPHCLHYNRCGAVCEIGYRIYHKPLIPCIIKHMRYRSIQRTDGRARLHRLRYAALACLALVIVAAGGLFWLHQHHGGDTATSRVSAQQSQTDSHQIVAGDVLRRWSCGVLAGPKHDGLKSSSSPQLRKLAQYEAACGGAVTNRTSLFVPLFTTEDQMKVQVESVSSLLKEYARFNISPLVFLEPHTIDGTLVDMETYRTGGYDKLLDGYFAGLKAKGITDSQMGLWNPQPEGNIPVWGNTDPATFGDIVRRTVTLQKKHFPKSKASVLLESKTYPAGENWSGGAYTSLLPYVQNLKGIIDSFGLQGFPSGPVGTDPGLLDPDAYLRSDIAIEAAQALGVKQVWFNTGSFSVFAKDASQPLTLTPQQRQDLLGSVLTIVQNVKQAGFQPAVHIFARDKTHSSEKTDWSYWEGDQYYNSEYGPVIKTFINDTKRAGIAFWLYDYE